MSVRSDAELARAWQAGDHTAFAQVYEKYSPSLFGVAMGLVRDRSAAADVVHDTFVRAARRIDALREPDRLRAWLFAILRNEATDWYRGRGRESAEDVAAMSEHLAADLPDPHIGVSRSELADVVWSAAGALQQRDREVLELHLRAGLEAGDLADALGVTPGHAAVLLSRMRDRMEKAIGALLIARQGRRECGTLDGLLANWDGRFTLDVRSRVTRHVESCPVCTRGRMQLASYARLAPAVLPVFLVPELLREKVLTSFDLVAQRLPASAGPGDLPAPDTSADSWSWRDDGFPEPQPTKPTGTVTDGDGSGGSGGIAGGVTLAVATGAGLLAAGIGGQHPQQVADPWTLPAEHLPAGHLPAEHLPAGHPPPGTPPPPPFPAPRRGVPTPLLIGGLVALLLTGGVGTWKIASSSPGPDGPTSPSVTVGMPQNTGDGVTTDPTVTTSAGTTSPTTSGTATTSPSSTGTATGPTTATGTATGPTTGTAAAAAHLAVGATGVPFGGGRASTTTRRTVTLANDGGQALTWTARTGAGFAVSAGSGTLTAGQSTTLTIALNRTGLTEGPVSGTLEIGATPTGQSFRLALTGSVNNPPVITLTSRSPTLAYAKATPPVEGGTCNSTTGGLSATVTDDSGVASVTVSWSDGGTQSRAMSQDGAPWYGSYGPFNSVRTYTLTITATDVRRNAGTSQFTVSVVAC